MKKIQVLDKSVSNKIAAGEVVERPASVVKELLENALDAGAKHVVVEIKNGGVSYIRVADDGCGIPRDEVPTALLRHATSKIREAEDLDAIITLGFRGEALSSIAAVSRLEIYTRTYEEETGTHLEAIDGEVTACEEAGCPRGTTVIVRDLFLTTPARMKFLKKNHTEAGYVADLVNRLALAHPDVSFRFISDGKEQLYTSGNGDLLQVIYAVYGKELKNAMLPASYGEDGVLVEGFCATSAGARANRSMQSFFVNGRYIKSPLLVRAAEEAYKNELMGGKFPACVLTVKLNPGMVDINVHPTKLEAKFADEKSVYHCVYWAVKNALYQKKEVPAVVLSAEETGKEQVSFIPSVEKKATVEVTTHKVPIYSDKPIAEPVKKPGVTMRESSTKPQADPFVWKAFSEKLNEKVEAAKGPKEMPVPPIVKNIEQPDIPPAERSAVPLAQKEWEMPVKEQMSAVERKKNYHVCGRIFDTYIIVEQEGEMLLIDQHAAHERLRYEALLKAYENKQAESQLLLLPVTLRLTEPEEAIFEEYQEEIRQFGFEAEWFGDKTVILRGAPEALDEESLTSMFLEVLGHLGDRRKDARSTKAQRALYTIACKSAVKAGNKLTDQEVETLLEQIMHLPAINTCPHGRPISVAFTKGFIEKQFKRIV
ncbi:MAG: DNA mismatch repair endonuclease MutL [Ruminococcaceae bacterium]|nr:DNA mismatch repair endonuclease MutL [Oscillospiraceae bacterium]